MRLDSGKGVVVFTSHEACERAYKGFKEGRIGRFEVQLRPYIKDSYSVFMGGVNSSLTAEQVRESLADYEPIISCQLMPINNPKTCNAAVAFSSE